MENQSEASRVLKGPQDGGPELPRPLGLLPWVASCLLADGLALRGGPITPPEDSVPALWMACFARSFQAVLLAPLEMELGL